MSNNLADPSMAEVVRLLLARTPVREVARLTGHHRKTVTRAKAQIARELPASVARALGLGARLRLENGAPIAHDALVTALRERADIEGARLKSPGWYTLESPVYRPEDQTIAEWLALTAPDPPPSPPGADLDSCPLFFHPSQTATFETATPKSGTRRRLTLRLRRTTT